ncbi:DUF2059 domain-containing protein [Labrenzia sp. PHM005]|uniref:DUF2059 domain-containing protein n=1 Tax=Labrenzia sp. PHM005 TaxID=2590016 RepID=UPI00113FFBBC|nr:DUF2059 domain-containing protein [Labrenzia sp. PHM005]QDG78103.1 DUF2059 domain-containing protein [Labrenzia sp. PHM005]
MKSMKFARIGLAMMTLGAISGNAVAQDSFSDSHIEAAKAVAIETKVLEPFDAILFVMSEQTLSAFTQNDPTRAEEIAEVVQNVALQLAPRRAELNQEIYRVWAGAFTEEELVQLAEFYRTPLGSKLRDSIAEITGKSVNASREWQDRLSVDMVAMVQEELTKGETEAPKE